MALILTPNKKYIIHLLLCEDAGSMTTEQVIGLMTHRRDRIIAKQTAHQVLSDTQDIEATIALYNKAIAKLTK